MSDNFALSAYIGHFCNIASVMPNTPIHPKLAHLSGDDIAELLNQYYAKKPIGNLIALYGIDCRPSQLYSLFPPETSTEPCPSCGTAMVLRRLSRSAYQNEYKHGLECRQCSHREKKCRCSYCLNKTRHEASKTHGSQLYNRSQVSIHKIKVSDLSLFQAVSLLALKWSQQPSKVGSHSTLSPSKLSNTPFAPSGHYTEQALTNLLEAELLIQSAQSTAKGFHLESGRVSTIHPTHLSLSNAVTTELISELETLIIQRQWPAHWDEQIFDSAFDLAAAECREFYDFCSSQRMFPMIDDKLINAMIRNLLEDYSTGQSFRIILSGAQYAADFLVTKAATPRMAANYMVESCQRFADKARVENWTLKAVPRNANCPRSMMSIVLYDFILQAKGRELDAPVALISLH